MHIGAYVHALITRYTTKLGFRPVSSENGHLIALVFVFMDRITIRIMRAEHNREKSAGEFRLAEPPRMSRRHSR